MSKIDDGGPAYPCAPDDLVGSKGMTLRDYFAGQAMQGSRARHSTYTSWDDLASDAYEIADAMLAARAKGGADGHNT